MTFEIGKNLADALSMLAVAFIVAVIWWGLTKK
jgi:hypothetical protein